MILFNQETKTFHLKTSKTSYLMKVLETGHLLHLYWGRPLKSENLDYTVRRKDWFSFVANTDNIDAFHLESKEQEYPGYGSTDLRSPAIELEFADGTSATDFRYVDYKIVDGKPALEGLPATYVEADKEAQTLIITLTDKVKNVDVELSFTVFEEYNAIARSVKVINKSADDVKIQRVLSANVDFKDSKFEMIQLSGSWARERHIIRTPLRIGGQCVESRRGASSHAQNPFMALVRKDATETNGDVYAMSLVYSGNFLANTEVDMYSKARMQIGINPFDFTWLLKAGEEFQAPEAVLVYSNEGLTGMSHTYQNLYGKRLMRGVWRDKARPVLINNWEATYFDFNEEKIEKIAAQAGELGIEMMVLDDGWFGKRDDDNSGLGDWFVNEKKIRGGLPKLSEKIHEKGMKFGLWFEPEMISEDSDLYRAHPDWAITIPGRVPNHARNQLVLDMTRSDVRDYLMARFEEILGNTKIEYVKWDMNRSICDMYSHIYKGEQSGECYHRYILGVYDLLERFVQRFPEILLEGCSGGGGRFDAGMLYYSPQIWCSDNTDAMNRLDIQYGTSFFYPISSIGAHVSACPNHQTGRSVPLSTRADVALAGSFGYELDLRLLSDEEKAQVKEQIKEFHDYYDLTHEGDYYRLTERDNTSFTAWEFVAKNKERALVEVVKKDAWGNPLPVHVAIKGLEDNSMYVCSLNGIKRSGKTWNHAGITLPKFLSAGESMKFTFMKVE